MPSQAEASGDAGLSFEIGGRSFDDFDANGLVDRKYGHGSSVFNADGSVHNQSRVNSMIQQAEAQLGAAGDIPIRWEVSTELGQKGIQELFIESGIDRRVDFVPQQKLVVTND